MLTEQNGIQVDKFYPPMDWQYSFPEGYTRLEYLESSGALQQYIYTNYNLQSNNLKVKAKFSYDFNNQTERDFIGNQDGSTNRFVIGVYQKKIFAYSRDSSGTDTNAITDSYSGEQTIDLEVNYDWDNQIKSITINGITTTASYTKNISPSNNTIQILASGNSGQKFVGKTYYCQIFDNNVLVRNYISVKRDSDGIIGFYDLVNNTFVYNIDGDAFNGGLSLYQNHSSIDIRQKKNTNFVEKYKFNANNELVWANPQLNLSGPVGYTKVGNPTIEDGVVSGFSGNNHLNISQQFALSSTTKAEFVFKVNSNSFINDDAIFGSLTNYGLSVLLNQFGNLQLFIGNYNSWTTSKTSSIALSLNTDYWVKLVINNNITTLYYSIDGATYNIAISSTNINLSTENNYNIGIGCGRTTSAYFRGSIDLKETYIKVNDKLWFYGKNYTSENYAPVPAGLNYNNTTTPSIGYVNTQTQEFIPAPTDGIKYSQTRDIKVISPEDNTITLLYGVKSDFSKYALFGLSVRVSSGTYDVYIDDILYATTASETQTDIDFSTLGAEYVSIGTCTTPEELVLHKIVIKPNTNGSTITKFQCKRTTGATGTQQQGILWTHFELENSINLQNLLAQTGSPNYYINGKNLAITSKNNIINIINNASALSNACYQDNNLIYISKLVFNSSTTYGLAASFYSVNKLKRLVIDNLKSSGARSFEYSFAGCYNMEQLLFNKDSNVAAANFNYALQNNRKLKFLPKMNFTNTTKMTAFLTAAQDLYPTKIDTIAANSATITQTYGTSTYPMRGLRGLKVSNEAPFSGSSPQINVSYTGLDRDALVELFNSLPDVSEATDGITRQINITATTGNNLTKVGTPTIDANGIASGFNLYNYLQLQTDFNNNNFEIVLKLENIGTANLARTIFNLQGSSIYIGLGESNQLLWNGISGFMFNSGFNTSGILYIKAIKNGLNYSFGYSNDGITYNMLNTTLSSQLSYTSPNNILRSSNWNNILVKIDLNNTYIKVDNNYIMKGYLTDNDRIIATNKGWTITG